MSTLKDKLKHELHELIPVTVFFFAAFQLLALTDALIAMRYGIRTSAFISATIMALVVAKVVIIADHLRIVNRFPDKPLIYNIVWKTAIYFVATLVVRYVEQMIHFLRKAGNVIEANQRLFQEIIWPHFWGVQLWLLVLLLFFCTVRELIRILGRDRIIGILFHDPGSNPET